MGSKLCANMFCYICVFCERKNSMTCVSSPVGVTSHTTPLSIRRGVGGEASVRSVREKTLQRVVCVLSYQERWLSSS